jgi:hypothetical protein
MPQLDKYIFFNHVFYLTIFFFLIYIYIRKNVVTNFSTIIKYRAKKTELLSHNSEYQTILIFWNSFFEKKLKNYLIKLLYSVFGELNIFKKNLSLILLGLSNKFYTNVKFLFFINSTLLNKKNVNKFIN